MLNVIELLLLSTEKVGKALAVASALQPRLLMDCLVLNPSKKRPYLPHRACKEKSAIYLVCNACSSLCPHFLIDCCQVPIRQNDLQRGVVL